MALLAGPVNTTLILNTRQVISAMEDPAEVIVLGCQREGYVQAAALAVEGSHSATYHDPDLLRSGCSQPASVQP